MLRPRFLDDGVTKNQTSEVVIAATSPYLDDYNL